MVGIRKVRRLSIGVDVADQATAQLAGINAVAQKAGNSFDDTATKADELKKAMAGWAAIAGGAALAMGAMTRMGARLDRTFAVIEESANATTGQMERIRDQTKQLGAEMPVTMNEVTKAFEQFTYAGLSAEEAIEASEGAVELAVAGQMNMADAVKNTTAILNAFNLEASQANYVATTLSTTFANSAITIDEIGSAMQYAAQQMSGMGFAASETAAAIGVMADQGMRGTMAGTSLNQAFSQLISSTGKAEEALSAAGLSIEEDFVDQEGNMLAMTDIIETLSEKAEQLDENELMQWLEDLAGRRGARALRPLISNFEEFEQKVRANALGAVKEFSDEMDDASQARIALGMQDDFGERRLERIQDMSDEEVVEMAAELNVDTENVEGGIDTLETLNEQADEFSEAELGQRIATMFDMELDTAKELASMLQDEETSMQEVADAYEEATTAGELKEAQMNTVAGRMEYLRGSIMSAAYAMYEGFRPAIKAAMDILIFFIDVANENEKVLQALGVALFVVGTYAAVATARITALWVTQTKFYTAMAASTSATWAYVLALGGATKAAWATFWAEVSLTNIKGALNAATSTYINTLFKSNSAKLRSTAGTLMQAQANVTLAGTIQLVLLSMWPLLAVTIAVIAAFAAILAYQRNFMGFADAVDNAIARVREGLDYLVGKIMQAIEWLRTLNMVGKIFIVGMIAMISPPLAVAAAIAFLVNEILNFLGIDLGGAITGMIDSLGGLEGVIGVVVETIKFFAETTAFMIRIVITVIEIAAGAFETFTQGITDAIKALFGPLLDMVTAAGSVEATFLTLLAVASPMAGAFLGIAGAGVKVGGVFGLITDAAHRLFGFVLDATRFWLNILVKVADMLGILRLAIWPILVPLYAIHGVFTALEDDGVGVLEAVRESILDLFEPVMMVLEGLENIWDLLRDIAFSPFDLSLDFELPDFSLGEWVQSFKQELDQIQSNMEEWLKDQIGEEAYNKLEWLEEKLFGWIPDADDAKAAGEATRKFLGRIGDAIEDFEINPPNWEEIIPDWVQEALNVWDGGNNNNNDGPDEGMGPRREDEFTAASMNPAQGALGSSFQYLSAPQQAQQGAQTAAGYADNLNTVQPQPTTGRAQASAQASGPQRGIEYIDDRTLDISQDPTIEISMSGSDLDRGALQRQIEAAMQNTKRETIEDIIDFIALGGPSAVGAETTGGDPGRDGGGEDSDTDTGGSGEDGDTGGDGTPPESDAPDSVDDTDGQTADESNEMEGSSPSDDYNVNDVRGSAEPTYTTL